MERRPSALWRLAPCVLFGVALVQFVSVGLLYVFQPEPRAKRAERARIALRTAQGAAITAGNASGTGNVGDGTGMEQTKKWLNVVSGPPHWLSPSEGSDALLLGLEREANKKFGLPPIPPAAGLPPPSTAVPGRARPSVPSARSSPGSVTAQGGGARTLQAKGNAVSGLHAFYYAWYGTPEVDGKWIHWNHEVLPHWGGPAVNSKYPTVGSKHKPPERIGSNFFPSLGPYSSRDATVIHEHVEMFARAGIGVLVYSWWGRIGDANGDPTDDAVILEVGRACVKYRVKLAFHLEPYKGRTAQSVRLDLQHLISRYGNHTALYRIGQRPAFYVYDSYHTSPEEWHTLLGVSNKQPCLCRCLGAHRQGSERALGADDCASPPAPLTLIHFAHPHLPGSQRLQRHEHPRHAVGCRYAGAVGRG